MRSQKKPFQLVLVENDDNDVFFITRALRRAGFDEPLARLKDGQYAIDYFSKLEEGPQPDLVLLDIQMPRLNGFEVLSWLRQQPSYKKLPVIMLTSSEDPRDLRQAKTLGATDFVTKKSSLQKRSKARNSQNRERLSGMVSGCQ